MTARPGRPPANTPEQTYRSGRQSRAGHSCSERADHCKPDHADRPGTTEQIGHTESSSQSGPSVRVDQSEQSLCRSVRVFQHRATRIERTLGTEHLRHYIADRTSIDERSERAVNLDRLSTSGERRSDRADKTIPGTTDNPNSPSPIGHASTTLHPLMNRPSRFPQHLRCDQPMTGRTDRGMHSEQNEQTPRSIPCETACA